MDKNIKIVHIATAAVMAGSVALFAAARMKARTGNQQVETNATIKVTCTVGYALTN
jgi:hypothetical protein